MKNLRLLIIAVAMVCCTQAYSQLETPQPSPAATVEQAVGLGTVTVDYSRPGMKDRAIFGALVPYGEIWRLGANASTKIEFSEDVEVGGQKVPAGKYALYAIPNEASWTIVLNKNLEHWGTMGYNKEEDQCRFSAIPTKLSDKVETLTIDFSNFTTEGAHLNILWENTKVAIPIKTNALADVEASIEKIMAGPDAGTYYSAARFNLDNGKDLNKALEWINKAVDMRPEAFWYTHLKAKIQGEMGMKKEAIATATKSMETAKANPDGDYGYVKNNEKLIEELKGK